MVNGRGDPDNIADRPHRCDMESSSVGTGIDHRYGQGQIPLTMFRNVDCMTAEIFGVVLAKLLNPLALVHSALRVWVSRQFDRSAAGQAELQIKAGGVSLSVVEDQH